MNKLYILGIILFFTNIGLTQTSGIIFAINDSNSGTGLHLSYAHAIKERINFGGGVRIHLNPNIKYRGGALYDHTFYAKNINQRIGLNVFFDYLFKENKWKLKPFVGYHSQILSTARKFVSLSQPEPVLFEWKRPITVWNNMLVFGLNYDLTESLSLKTHAGLGFSSLFNIDERVLSVNGNPNNNNSWQFNTSFNLGVAYWFTSKDK